MATVTAVTASPAEVELGGTSTITPTISNPSQTAKVKVTLEGSSGEANVTIKPEKLTYTTNAAEKGKPGVVVFELSEGPGSLAISGATAIYTS